MTIGALAGAAVGDWSKLNSHTELRVIKNTGDLVGDNGFREAWESAENGKMFGRHGCSCSGHSFGPAGPDTWSSSLTNSIASTWRDPDATGEVASFQYQVAYKNRHVGQSDVQNGATYAAVFITRVNRVLVTLDGLVVRDEWLGLGSNRVSTLQGIDSFDSTVNLTVLEQNTGMAISGSELVVTVDVYTHVDWGGDHPPEVSSYFAAFADADQTVLLASKRL